MTDEQRELFLKAQQSLEIEAQSLRTTGDYGQLNALTAEPAAEQIAHAESFLVLASQELGDI